MEIDEGQDGLLERGGRPTLRELLRALVFSPRSGTIRLNKERLILQRANHTSRLRDQLVERYGRDEAFIVLTRIGFMMGMDDADFVRRAWPALDPGDTFTAGTRLHMLCGCVRLKTVHNDFDFRKGRFSGEFLWIGSAEAVEHCRNHPRSDEPVCWSQVGYASGYATRCLGKLIVYKELECLATGHEHCRVLGKPAEIWGEQDELVQLYQREIVPSGIAPSPGSRASAALGDDEDPISRIVLAPVRDHLEKFARFDVPLLITGEAGTGKRTAARAWSEMRFGVEGQLDIVAGDTLDSAGLDALFNRPVIPSRGRRPRHSQRRIILTDIDLLAPSLQRRLSRHIAQGESRIAATSRLSLAELCGCAGFDRSLFHRLAAASLAMKPLRSRRNDLPVLIEALMEKAAKHHGVKKPVLAATAMQAIAELDLLGNLTELNALLTAALISAAPGEIIGPDFILALVPPHQHMRAEPDATNALRRLATGAASLPMLNDQICQEAVERSDGNVSAAARMLGLTRPQLAYRLKRIKDK